jgi:hypothetical protein
VTYKGIQDFEKAAYIENLINRSNFPENKLYKAREFIKSVKAQRIA